MEFLRYIEIIIARTSLARWFARSYLARSRIGFYFLFIFFGSTINIIIIDFITISKRTGFG